MFNGQIHVTWPREGILNIPLLAVKRVTWEAVQRAGAPVG